MLFTPARSLLHSAPMGSRLASWVLLIYLATSLANPLLPGAFQFTPEEGFVWVEAAYLSREGTEPSPSEGKGLTLPARRRDLAGGIFAPQKPGRAWDLTAWLVRVRSGEPPAHDFPPSDSDDH
jgi:hypothetical protein